MRATLMAQGAGSTTGQAPRFPLPRGAWACWNPSSTDDRLSALDRGEFAASAGGGQPKAFRYLAELSLRTDVAVWRNYDIARSGVVRVVSRVWAAGVLDRCRASASPTRRPSAPRGREVLVAVEVCVGLEPAQIAERAGLAASGVLL